MGRTLVWPRWGAFGWLVLDDAIAALVVVVLLARWVPYGLPSACERALEASDRHRALDICLSQHQEAPTDRNVIGVARAHKRLLMIDKAEHFASKLLLTSRYGDAHSVLSYVALVRESGIAAKAHAAIALFAHKAAGDERSIVSDLVSLSQASLNLGEFTAALDLADEATRLAPSLEDPRYEVPALIARADALRRIGAPVEAVVALNRALALKIHACDRMSIHLKAANMQLESEQDSLALHELEMARRAHRECPVKGIESSIMAVEAWALRARDPAAALARLDRLAELHQEEGPESIVLRGYLAADRGDTTQADHYLRLAGRLEPSHADWPWQIECSLGEVWDQLHTADTDARAEAHFRRSIELVAALRTTTRARSAYLVLSHRAPYDGLIALLARNGRWRDALAVVLELDASDMLRSTAAERVIRDDVSLKDVETAKLAVSSRVPNVDDVLSAWHSRELVIVIAQAARQISRLKGRAYRMRIVDGEVTGEDVGSARAARTRVTDLFVDPSNAAAAREVGQMLVPADTSERPLYILAVGALGKAPLAALRSPDNSLLVGHRPLVRVLALHAIYADSVATGAPAVLADPRGDLPSAAAEGRMAINAIGGDVRASGSRMPIPATCAQLWAASDASLLHFAGHVDLAGPWRALQLADGEIDSTEIAVRRFAPRVAILAGCGSAAATDEEGWGSIAAALLEAGTTVVIATDRSVDDKATLEVMRRFYAQPNWRTDPARALGQVQNVLDTEAVSKTAAHNPASWAAFTVLGRPPTIATRSAAR